MSLFDVELEVRLASVGSGENVSFWSYIVVVGDNQGAACDKARSLVETHFRKFAPLVSAFEVQVASVKVAPDGCPISRIDGMGAWSYESTRREAVVDSSLESDEVLSECFWEELVDRLSGVFATFVREHNRDNVIAFGADTNILNGEILLCATLVPNSEVHTVSLEWSHQDIGFGNAEWENWWKSLSGQILGYFANADFANAEESRNIIMKRLVRAFLAVDAQGVFRFSSAESRPRLQVIDHDDTLDIAVERVVRETAQPEGKV